MKNRFMIYIITAVLVIICIALRNYSVGVDYKDKTERKTDVSSISPPELSKDSGFYDDSFELSMKAEEGCTIYYTTNGSVPSKDNESTKEYTEPLLISDRNNDENYFSVIQGMSVYEGDYAPLKEDVDKATPIRAIAVNSSGEQSEVVSRTYFVGFNNKSGYDMDIVSVFANEDDLFGYKNGICVAGRVYDRWVGNQSKKRLKKTLVQLRPANYNQHGKQWERPIYIEFFDPEHNKDFGQNAGIRMHGGATRGIRQKSFNVYSREIYGSDSFVHPLLGQYATKTVVLRSGGNDRRTKIRDIIGADLMRNRNIEVAAYKPVQMFLNGEYWGMYNLQERLDGDYISDHYNIDKDNVIMVRLTGDIDEGYSEDLKKYNDFKRIITSDLTVKSNYDKLCQTMDIQSFMDYYCAEIYYVNNDWHGRNYKMWRSKVAGDHDKEDTKWRFMLFDVDYAFDLFSEDNGQYDSIKDCLSKDKFFSSCMKNSELKERFVTTFMDLLNSNLCQERINKLIDEKAEIYKTPAIMSLKRYFGGEPGESDFEGYIATMKHFVDLRKDYLIGKKNEDGTYTDGIIKTDLGLSGKVVELNIGINNSDAGEVCINTLTETIPDNGWKGYYYTDYPVRLKAQPKEGYKFCYWELPEGISYDEEIELTLDNDTEIRAIYEGI